MIEEANYQVLRVKKHFNLDKHSYEYGIGSYHKVFRFGNRFFIPKSGNRLIEVCGNFLSEHMEDFE